MTVGWDWGPGDSPEIDKWESGENLFENSTNDIFAERFEVLRF